MAGLASGDEVKTARLHPAGAQGGNSEVTIDAQEDREIVGLDVQPEPPSGADTTGKVEVFVGSRNFQGGNQARDNLNFFMRNYWDINITNGYAFVDSSPDGEFFGKDSGLEWNEDATLTARVAEDTGNGAAEAFVTVYYREL